MVLFVFLQGQQMAEVVYLNVRKPIPPKSETFKHAGQQYTCTFDPNAPPDQQWVWQVRFTRVYEYYGSSQTMEAASKAARLKIHKLVRDDTKWEENQ
jgi:hypothetical protein